MAFVELSKEKNKKLVLSVSNALNYKDKEGNLKTMQEKTALTTIMEEASKLAKMNKGTVTASFEIDGKYENYFVNKMGDTNNIAFQNVNNKEDTIYLNAVNKKKDNGYFYAINDSHENAKKLIEKIGKKEVQNQDSTKSTYLKARIQIKNDELKKELEEKGDNHLAIISKNGIKIVSRDELKKTQAESSKDINKSQEVKKKVYKPKEKNINKAQELER